MFTLPAVHTGGQQQRFNPFNKQTMNPHEEIGKLYCEVQRLLAEYQKLLGIVQCIKAGEIQAEQIEVDLANSKWAIKTTENQPDVAIAENTNPEPG